MRSTGDGADEVLDGVCADADGNCTLRAAIAESNANVDKNGNKNIGKHRIEFDIPETDPGFDSGTGVFTIKPQSQLPDIEDRVVIVGNNKIVLDGSESPAVDGLVITKDGNSRIQGLQITGFGGNGIVLDSSHNTIGRVAASETAGVVYTGEGNSISLNTQNGVFIKSGTENAFLSNSIFDNNGLSIDTNDVQLPPALITVDIRPVDGEDKLVIKYKLGSDPGDATLVVEFFKADADDQESKVFLGSDTYTQTDFSTAGGVKDAVLDMLAGTLLEEGDPVVATATDDKGNTSVFSGSGVIPVLVDLSISTSDSPDPVLPGNTLTYNITITNESDILDATGVEATITLGSQVDYDSDDGVGAYNNNTGIWNIGDLEKGTSKPLQIKITVKAGTPLGTTISSTVQVTSVEGDSDAGNNLATITTSVNEPQIPAQPAGGGFAPLPILVISPTSFTFTATEGDGSPPAQTLEISNTGFGVLNWTVSDDADWLTPDPLSGGTLGQTDTVTLSVDTTGLASGEYQATVTVNAPGAAVASQKATVTLVINALPAEPEIAVSPTSLSFDAIREGIGPEDRVIQIWNAGGQTTNWQATIS